MLVDRAFLLTHFDGCISLTREAILDVERLRVRSLEVLAESERLLDLIDKINSRCIQAENK
jgi:hypothetical protein